MCSFFVEIKLRLIGGKMKHQYKKKENMQRFSLVEMSVGIGVGLIGGIIFQNLPVGLLIGVFLSTCLDSNNEILKR